MEATHQPSNCRARPVLRCGHWLYRLIDPRACRVDIKSQSPQYGAEETAVLHTIAAAAIAELDDLGGKGLVGRC